jgi:hypothetical protein
MIADLWTTEGVVYNRAHLGTPAGLMSDLAATLPGPHPTGHSTRPLPDSGRRPLALPAHYPVGEQTQADRHHHR